jgi:hypothetical protein
MVNREPEEKPDKGTGLREREEKSDKARENRERGTGTALGREVIPALARIHVIQPNMDCRFRGHA